VNSAKSLLGTGGKQPKGMGKGGIAGPREQTSEAHEMKAASHANAGGNLVGTSVQGKKKKKRIGEVQKKWKPVGG